MKTQVYEVAGGWQAEDDELMIACFGRDRGEAEKALDLARQRARAIAERWATMGEAEEHLSDEDMAEIAEAEAEIARGESRRESPAQRIAR